MKHEAYLKYTMPVTPRYSYDVEYIVYYEDDAIDGVMVNNIEVLRVTDSVGSYTFDELPESTQDYLNEFAEDVVYEDFRFAKTYGRKI